jgi:hypothetical protein
MKKSELQQIIKEEISKVLTEAEDPIQTAFIKAITKDGDVKLGGSGARNIMRPKLIDIMFTDNQRYYKTLVDGKLMGLGDTEDLIKNLTGVDMTLNRMDDEKLEDVANILKSKNIKLNWSDVFDPS